MIAAFLLSLLLPLPTHSAVLVHGHRGCRGTRPENTLAAFKEALRVGADVLELDLAVTKDDVLVVSHDPRLEPGLCLGPGGEKLEAPVVIRTLTLAEVKQYDCGSLKNPRFPRQVPQPGERVPTLAEVFELAAKTQGAEKVQFNVETKIFPAYPEVTPPPAEFAALLLKAAAQAKVTDRLIVQSFDYRTLEAVKGLDERVRTAQLTSDNLVNAAALAADGDLDFLSPDYQWVTKAQVEELHGMKVEVAPWTVNDEAGWQKMADLGVDAVITDYPEDLVAWLKKKGLRR